MPLYIHMGDRPDKLHSAFCRSATKSIININQFHQLSNLHKNNMKSWKFCIQFIFYFSFHSNLLSCMNGKDKQQVYGCIRVHLVYGNSFSGNFHEMMSAQSDCKINHEKISSLSPWHSMEKPVGRAKLLTLYIVDFNK